MKNLNIGIIVLLQYFHHNFQRVRRLQGKCEITKFGGLLKTSQNMVWCTNFVPDEGASPLVY